MAMSDEMAFLIKDLAVSRVERKGLEKPQGIRHVQDPASPTFWSMNLDKKFAILKPSCIMGIFLKDEN